MSVENLMDVAVTRRRFDVDEYHRLATAGILSKRDRVELIDGQVIAMTPIGRRHVAAVNRASRASFSAIDSHVGVVQVQSPIRLNRLNEPQPDLAVLRPAADFYASHLPSPADILLIVEIADASVDYDRNVKSRVYAESNVPEYWLADINERFVLRHTDIVDGEYRRIGRHEAGESIAPNALPKCRIAVDDLMAE